MGWFIQGKEMCDGIGRYMGKGVGWGVGRGDPEGFPCKSAYDVKLC